MNCNSKREELKSLVVSDYEKPDGQGQVEQQQAIDAWLKLGEAKSNWLQLNRLDWDGIDPTTLTWWMLNQGTDSWRVSLGLKPRYLTSNRNVISSIEFLSHYHIALVLTVKPN